MKNAMIKCYRKHFFLINNETADYILVWCFDKKSAVYNYIMEQGARWCALCSYSV